METNLLVCSGNRKLRTSGANLVRFLIDIKWKVRAMLRRRSTLFPPISMKELESHPVISHARANKELGYQPRPLAQTIIDTVNWFRSNGFLDKTNQHLA